jgi:uncharacterized protein (DUF2236 family)
VLFYERTVRPLTSWQRDLYHRESLEAARLLGLPPDRVPPGYAATEEYISDMVSSGRLMATDVSRDVAALAGGRGVPFRWKPLWAIASLAAIGTLPPPIRELYGFRWSNVRQRTLDAVLWMVKRLRPFVPKQIRWVAVALIAERRISGESVDMLSVLSD